MKIIYNKYFPPKPFRAINLFCLVFARKDGSRLSPQDINHEAIHSMQMKELLFVPFYLLYLSEWLWGLFKYRNTIESYLNISFEREAYHNESKLEYLQGRTRWSSFSYMKTKNKVA